LGPGTGSPSRAISRNALVARSSATRCSARGWSRRPSTTPRKRSRTGWRELGSYDTVESTLTLEAARSDFARAREVASVVLEERLELCAAAKEPGASAAAARRTPERTP